MNDLAIKAKGVTHKFGDFTAVDQVDLSIPKQKIYGFLGPNGSGKSTMMRMLTGLLSITAGSIEVLGMQLPKDAEALRLRIGYMTQKFSLYDDLTIYENLNFMAKIYNIPKNNIHKRIQSQLNTYALDRCYKQLAGSLSGGQRQRLALAAATLHQPELLFLDEPTSAVDPENRRNFWETLFDLCDQGTTILVSTHYMDEAERCHALAILEAGKKRADGSPKQLMTDMSAHTIEIDGSNLREISKKLGLLPDVLSVAQQGAYLRVLVSNKIKNVEQWLQQQQPELLRGRNINVVRPSLEDVFVYSTKEGRQ
jgi:ABC-2 type transport system ATP-binding protein